MSQTLLHQDRVFRDDTLAVYQRGVELAIATMRQRLSDPLTQDDLADTTFMSRYHFNRVFTKITGVSPGRFLAAIRMQEAKRLLLQTERSVTDISLDVGYKSLGTFSRIFSDAIGFSPVRFRQLARPLRMLPFESVIAFLRPQREFACNAPLTGDLLCGNVLKLSFVALFSTAIPRSHPIECVVLQATTHFAFDRIPCAGSHIYVAGMLPEATFEDAVLATPGRIVIGTASLAKYASRPICVAISLRTRSVIEPPILFAFPLALAQLLICSEVGNFGEADLTLESLPFRERESYIFRHPARRIR